MTRRLCACLVLVMAIGGFVTGCQDASAPVTTDFTVSGYVATAWNGGPITIDVAGVVNHRSPLAHSVKRAWLPLKSAATEGDQLAAGEAIAEIDAEVAERWRDNEVRIGVEREIDTERNRLRAEDAIAELHERLADLEGRVATATAAIAATRVKDDAQLAIAEQTVALANSKVVNAQEDVDRLRALVAAGVATERQLIQAENILALATAELAEPLLTRDILLETTNGTTRYRLQLDLASVEADLATAQDDLATRIAGDDRAGKLDAWDVERRRQQIDEFNTALGEPIIAAQAGGILRYDEPGRGVGSKPGASPFAFMLDPAGMIAEVYVRDKWRPWLQSGDGSLGSNAMLTVPALQQSFPARISSIAAQPEQAPDGTGSHFRVQLVPVSGIDDLQPGQQIIATITLAVHVGPELAVVPAWMIADRTHPRVNIIGTGVREIEGIFYGHVFIVTAGLKPGERLELADPIAQDGERLVGIVDPVNFHPIRTGGTSHRDGWRLQWMLPDGSEVTAGQQVAQLTYAGWGDPSERQFKVTYAELEAEARVIRERVAVATDVGRAAAAWRKSIIEANRQVFEEMVAYVDGDTTSALNRQAAVVRADNAVRTADDLVNQLRLPAARDALSADAAAGRTIRFQQAELALERAKLAEISARRADSYITQREAHSTAFDAQADVLFRHTDYVIARLQGQARLARALYDRSRAFDRLNRDRDRITGEKMVAPVAGRIYQRARPNGQLLRPGDWVDIDEPLVIPIGTSRQVQLEYPAHRLHDIQEGQTVSVVIPAVSREPRPAIITAIGRALVSPKAEAQDDMGLHRVVRVTIQFELAESELLAVPLGSTAYVDL